MGKAKCKPCSPRSARVVAPAWADPGLSLQTTGWRLTNVLLGAMVATQICKPDPSRIALYIGQGTAGLGSIAVGPTLTPNTNGFVISTTFSSGAFHQFTYGSLVQAAWFAHVSGATTIGVYELYLLP